MSAHQHEDDETCPACLERWQQADSVPQLRELTAQFIEGTLRARPSYGAATVATETADLTEVLAAINRGGLLTDSSQPGENAEGWVQRAWVSGYADEAVVDALLGSCLATDLLVLALAPGALEGARVCISRDAARESTWAGAFDDPMEMYANGSVELVGQLADLWCVDVIDPVWGRNDLLWPTVLTALTERPPRLYYEY